MPRSPEPTRERLVEAALDLFTTRGYAATTVDDIAQRAGVSPRTFFRHFPDKEEVLFAGDDDLMPLVTDAITAGNEPIAASELMAEVLGGLAAVMESLRPRLRERQRVIDDDMALTGRELAKQAGWQRSIASALVQRGFATHADLLAALGFALFRGELHRWLAEEEGPTLRERVWAALPEVRQVLDQVSRIPDLGVGHGIDGDQVERGSDHEDGGIGGHHAGDTHTPVTHTPVTYENCADSQGPFFHGTKTALEVGTELVPGHLSNFHQGRKSNNIYFTELVETAAWGAELATALNGIEERGHIYVVEPLGPFEDDPNVTNKRFPGNPTQSYRTSRPLRIVDELPDWPGHSPEVLTGMLDRLAQLREQGLDVIED